MKGYIQRGPGQTSFCGARWQTQALWSTNLEALQTILSGFYGAFPALCPLPAFLAKGQVGNVGLQVLTFQSQGWFPGQQPIFQCFPKITWLTSSGVVNRGLLCISRCLYCSYYLGNSRSLELSSRKGTKIKYLLLMDHSTQESPLHTNEFCSRVHS